MYSRVSHKTLRISKTFGIEGGKLLRDDDDYEIVKEFNQDYEGETTQLEAMRLELQGLLQADAGNAASRRTSPSSSVATTPHARHARPCSSVTAFRLADATALETDGQVAWTEEAGETRWYLFEVADASILEEPTEMIDAIRSVPDTPRRCEIDQPTLADIRGKVEKHIKNTRLKQLQAPVAVKPILKAWMELN